MPVKHLHCFLLLFPLSCSRKSHREFRDTAGDFGPELESECFYDDDEQPIFQEPRKSPRRRLLPSTPQSKSTKRKSENLLEYIHER